MGTVETVRALSGRTGVAAMYVKETLKHTLEQVTGNKPSKAEAREAANERKPKTFDFADDGVTPNNPDLPFVVYKGAVALGGQADPAAVFEELFAANGWGDSWRNGIYDYLHYHSRIHEVLGIARGRAQVRFGGDKGKVLDLEAGDVAVLPAGTGHHRLMASEDYLVVGAYPSSGTYDECTGKPDEHARALKTIPKVARPKADPVYGKDGPLMDLWR
jgi:uncharacterized protein YjlB